MKSFVVFAWLSLGLCSCSEMMDEIPNKVYIVNNACQIETVYNMGETYIYPVAVYKSGETDEVGIVKISEDKAYLEEYNNIYQTVYKLLPEAYYSMPERELEIPADQTRAISNITVDIAKIANDLGYRSDYVIPLKIESLNGNIQETKGKSNLLLVLDILRPTFKFSNEEVTDVWFSQHYDNMNFVYDVVIGSDFICKEDIHFELEIDPDAVDSYNKEGKDFIEMMPKDAYSIETTSIILKSGEKEVKTSVSVDGKSLKNWHSYAIPITIKSVSQSLLFIGLIICRAGIPLRDWRRIRKIGV